MIKHITLFRDEARALAEKFGLVMDGDTITLPATAVITFCPVEGHSKVSIDLDIEESEHKTIEKTINGRKVTFCKHGVKTTCEFCKENDQETYRQCIYGGNNGRVM